MVILSNFWFKWLILLTNTSQKTNFPMKFPINNVLKRSQTFLQITPDLCIFTEEILVGKL